MLTEQFARVEDLRVAVAQDAAAAARYPARFIFVNGLTAWRQVLELLDDIVPSRVLLSALAQDDALPNFQAIVDAIGEPASSLVLEPLGEIIRMAPGMAEPYVAWLTRLQWPGHTRIYIPLLDVSAAVMPVLKRMHQYLEYNSPVWCLDSDDVVTVQVSTADYRCLSGRRLDGIKSYLRWWEEGGGSAAALITGYAGIVAASQGSVRFEVLPTAYDVIKQHGQMHPLTRPEHGTDAQWRWLAAHLRPGESMMAAAGRLLEFSRFNADRLWELWAHFGPEQRWLAWLWAKNNLSKDGPAGQAISASASPEQFVAAAANLAYRPEPQSLDWLAERKRLLGYIAPEGLPASFWVELQAVNDPLSRLAALPGLSDREREAVVESVGQLAKAGVSSERWLPLVRVSFPELYSYLTANPLGGWLGDYMYEYKLSRLADEATPRLLAAASQWSEGRQLWGYEARAQMLHREHIAADEALWVDGLGLEWAGLLGRLLTDRGLQVRVDVARANLPSVTAANHDWQKAFVYRELDSYAHSHDYAYPRSIVQQIRIVSTLAAEVQAQLVSRPQVTITSDHGSTRFASVGGRVEPPPGYEAHGWGRHARKAGDGPALQMSDTAWITDGDWLILARHGLFRGAGAGGGEVHGGATPEESLVPVLHVTGLVAAAPRLRCNNALVLLDVQGRGALRVALDAACVSLVLQLPRGALAGRSESETEWVFDLAGLKVGDYVADLVSDRGLVARVAFGCRRGMVEDDMGL